MSTSAAQALANRENAQLSTGPKTAGGKAISSTNAVRHNLTARGLVVPLGMENDFTGLEDGLREHLVPLGFLLGNYLQTHPRMHLEPRTLPPRRSPTLRSNLR